VRECKTHLSHSDVVDVDGGLSFLFRTPSWFATHIKRD